MSDALSKNAAIPLLQIRLIMLRLEIWGCEMGRWLNDMKYYTVTFHLALEHNKVKKQKVRIRRSREKYNKMKRSECSHSDLCTVRHMCALF